MKTTVSYDWGATLNNPNEFLISQLPLAKSAGNGGLLQFSAQQTSLYLNFVGLPGSVNQVGVFIVGNLLGEHYAPALQYAYLRYRGITVGYDKTLFCAPPSTPPTIDYEGPSASTAISSATLNYTFSFGKKKAWKAGIGVEMPICSLTESPEAVRVTQRVPDIPVFIQRSWMDGQGWLRLAGIMRNMYYRDLTSGKNVDKMRWGVLLSGHTPIVGGLSAYYQGVFGKGIARV